MGLDNPLHIAFLLILLLLVFGAKRLPEMGKSLGSGMRGFKDALGGMDTPSGLHAAPHVQTHATPAAVTQAAPVDQAVPVTQAVPLEHPAREQAIA